MNKHTLFDIWAPPQCPWSAWAKAAALSDLSGDLARPSSPVPSALDEYKVPALNPHTAMVVDLPGAMSIHFGLALAKKGYRPIVMINAVPQPLSASPYAVDVGSSVEAMIRFTPFLQQLNLRDGAPPAFLLDAARQGRGRSITPGVFDNRSVLFRSDFPSAARLREGQIDRVMLIHGSELPIERDLASVLIGWAEDGMPVAVVTPQGESIDQKLPKKSWLADTWLRFCASLLFHKNSTGHFGAIVPRSSGG